MSEMLKEKRATRGSRMTELVGEAAEEDELFWNNEVWQEADSDDDSFGSEDEEQKPDEFDSDFNDTESEEESDNEEEAQLNKRTKTVSKNKFKEPKNILAKRKAPSSSSTAAMNKDISNSSSRNLNIDENENKNGDGDDDVQLPVVKREKVQKKKRLQRELNNLKMFEDEESKRTVRASTKEKTIGSDRNRVQEDMIMKKKAKRITFQKFKPNFHQKDMLLEGLETEILNKKWLMNQKLVEEEKHATERSLLSSDKQEQYVRFLSRRGANDTYTFTSVEIMPAIFSLTPPEIPEKTCVITGLPAKYKDPKTGLPYANLEAFKELRKQYLEQTTITE